MAGAEGYSVQQWVIPAAEEITVDAVGSFVSCLGSSLPDFLLGIDADAPQYMAQGLTVTTKGRELFDRLVIANRGTVTGPLTVRLAWGTGFVQDARFTSIAPIALEIPNAFVTTLTDASIGIGSTSILLAQNDLRSVAFVHNLDSTITVRVGGSGTLSANRGIPLGPGQRIEITTTDDIYIHNPGASAVSIARAETITV